MRQLDVADRFSLTLLIATLLLLLVPAQGGVTGVLSARTAAAVVPGYDHIFFVIDENRSRAQIIGPAPYLTALANANAQSSNYVAVSHPSVSNYLALFSGQTFKGTINDNCTVGTGTCHTTAPNLADELIASGRTAKGYMESMPSPCYGPHDAGPYTERHNPFPYFDQIRNDSARCSNIVPYTQLASDLGSAATTPNFAWITPNLLNDMHNGSVAQGDAWAQSNFPAIFNSPAWKTQRSLLLFTVDEDNGLAGNNVAFFVVSSDGSTKTNYTSTVSATHYSALRTIEAAWGLGTMTANDAAASPMSDLFTTATTPPPSPDYSLAATPSSQTVVQGASTSYTVNVARTGAFTGSVTLSVTGRPSGASATFNPNPATANASTLTITTSTTAPTGSYILTITGGSASRTRTMAVTLVVVTANNKNCNNC